MADDLISPTQFDSIEDGQVVRTAAERVTRYARLSSIFEVVLVFIAAAALVTLAVVQLRTSQTNKRGVDRIISCTTPGLPCYEEQQTRTNELIGTFLVQLNEEHLTIECLLPTAPERRTEKTLAACRDKAKEETARQLEELKAKAKAQSDAAVQKEKEDGKSRK